MREQDDAHAWMEVRFRRANRPARRGARVQEWRSVRTGRVFEVEEGHAYAPSRALREGQRGYLRHVAGIPVVVADPADAPRGPLRGAPRGAPGRVPPAPPSRPRPRRRGAGGSWASWALLVALVLAVAWAWLR